MVVSGWFFVIVVVISVVEFLLMVRFCIGLWLLG